MVEEERVDRRRLRRLPESLDRERHANSTGLFDLEQEPGRGAIPGSFGQDEPVLAPARRRHAEGSQQSTRPGLQIRSVLPYGAGLTPLQFSHRRPVPTLQRW